MKRRDLRDGDASRGADPSAGGRLLRTSRCRLSCRGSAGRRERLRAFSTGLRAAGERCCAPQPPGGAAAVVSSGTSSRSLPRAIRHSILAFRRSHRLRLVRWTTTRSNCAGTSRSGPRLGWRSLGHWLRRRRGERRSQRSPPTTSTSTLALSRSRAGQRTMARIGTLTEWGMETLRRRAPVRDRVRLPMQARGEGLLGRSRRAERSVRCCFEPDWLASPMFVRCRSRRGRVGESWTRRAASRPLRSRWESAASIGRRVSSAMTGRLDGSSLGRVQCARAAGGARRERCVVQARGDRAGTGAESRWSSS